MRSLFLLLATLSVVSCSPSDRPLALTDTSQGLHATQGAWDISLVDEYGQSLNTYQHGTQSWIEGQLGRRYGVRVRNRSAQRIEAVITVDGRDVVSGQPGSLSQNGYVIAPYGEVVVEGFRTSMSGVATFRFTSPGDSYAGRVGGGANLGVVGVAVFAEAQPKPAPIARRDWYRGRASAPAKSAPAPRMADGESMADSAPGLGTQYGEHRNSQVEEVTFKRNSDTPNTVLAVYYDTRDGLVRRGIIVTPQAIQPHGPQPFPAGRRFAPPPP